MTSAADPLFLDTNVLVYAAWQTAPLHLEARAVLIAYRAAGARFVISRQVIREFLATLNRPQIGIPLPVLLTEVQHFIRTMQVCDETTATTNMLLTLLRQTVGTRIHDVNIVATMQT